MLTRHIPNIVTLCNLAVGVLAVLMALENQLLFASWLILLAAVLDFLDGLLARILDAASETGRQLDSFADLISFGLAPAALLYRLLALSLAGDGFPRGIPDTTLAERMLLLSPILLVLFSALRLARFNIAENSGEFTGLPTPAAAIFLVGWCFMVHDNLFDRATVFLLSPPVVLLVLMLLSVLMISRLPMFSLKFRQFGWKGNQIRYLFLAISGILLILLQEIALPVIILLYLLLSIVLVLIPNTKK